MAHILHKGYSINTKTFNILHFRAENSVSSFTMTIMMKMEVEWLQKRSNFQAHRAQIHFDFKSLVFQSRKSALIFFTHKNQFSLGLSFKIKPKQSDTYLLSRPTFSFLFEMLIVSFQFSITFQLCRENPNGEYLTAVFLKLVQCQPRLNHQTQPFGSWGSG